MKLSKKVKNQWTTALRSGKYKQGSGYLYNSYNNSYCCLGVASKIELCNESQDAGEENQLISKEFLSLKIQTELVNLNDSGNSFETIANYIEKNL